MTQPIFVATVISAGVFGLGGLGFLWKIAVEVRRTEEKRGRIYARIDEVKNGVRKDFVSEKVCAVKNEALCKDVAEIKTDVKELLRRKSGGE